MLSRSWLKNLLSAPLSTSSPHCFVPFAFVYSEASGKAISESMSMRSSITMRRIVASTPTWKRFSRRSRAGAMLSELISASMLCSIIIAAISCGQDFSRSAFCSMP